MQVVALIHKLKGEVKMENKQWLELVNTKYDTLVDVVEKCYEDAVYNQHMQFSVYLNENGSINVLQDVAGGLNYYETLRTGESIIIATICMRGYETDISDDEIESKLQENGIKFDIDEIKKEYGNLTRYMLEEQHELYKELTKEWMDCDISNYGREFAERELDNAIEQLK